MNEIFKRAKQFFRAVTARLTEEDEKYISAHLSERERKLFFAMSKPDQFHCLRTAYTVEKKFLPENPHVEKNFMIRCALLHDSGRVKNDLSIAGKIFTVLITKFFPALAEKLERSGNHALYIYKNHPAIGAAKLKKIGLIRESEIISEHHAKPDENDPDELKILRLADEEN